MTRTLLVLSILRDGRHTAGRVGTRRKGEPLSGSAVHVDYTARPQVVPKKHHKYYGLISAFFKLTGVPVLCNTSFNSRGMPLVNTPKDAVDCFLERQIDVLSSTTQLNM